MRIDPIVSFQQTPKIDKVAFDEPGHGVAKSREGASFAESVTKAVAEVNELQKTADDAAISLAKGEIEDVHQAMIAMQKARLAMDFTIQVRNKVIEAYQEVMRMQV